MVDHSFKHSEPIMDYKRLEDKLDKVMDMQGEMNVTLAKQSVILEEHVKRTNILEEKLAPVEKHVSLMKSLMKIGGMALTGDFAMKLLQYWKG